MHPPVDNAVVVFGPDGQAVCVSGRDVAQDVDLLLVQLGRLQLIDEPAELLSRVSGVQQQPPTAEGRGVRGQRAGVRRGGGRQAGVRRGGGQQAGDRGERAGEGQHAQSNLGGGVSRPTAGNRSASASSG